MLDRRRWFLPRAIFAARGVANRWLKSRLQVQLVAKPLPLDYGLSCKDCAKDCLAIDDNGLEQHG